jgi:hypothetical protein
MAVNLSPVGGVAGQFFDNNGNPLAGGKIFTYSAGTTTNQATYTSATGAIAHSNPIILDGAGRVPSGEIWLTDGLQYKFVITDSNNVLIGTYDNIVGINSNFVNFTNEQEIQTATAGQTVFTLTTMQYQPATNSLSVFVDGVNQYGPGALYAYVETDATTVTFTAGLHVGAEVKFTTSNLNSSAGGDAFQVSYTPPFIASVTTNVGDKLAQTVSVMDFGAVGDGVADDTAAIQAAITANLNGEIVFPNGTFLVSSAINLNLFGGIIRFSGKGSSIVAGDNNLKVFESTSNAYGARIIDARIDGNGFTGVTAFDLTRFQLRGAMLVRPVILNCENGIYLRSLCWGLKIDHPETDNVNYPITLVEGCNAILIDHPSIDNFGPIGIWVQQGGIGLPNVGNMVLNGFIQNGDEGLVVQSIQTQVIGTYFEGCSVADVSLKTGSGYFYGCATNHTATGVVAYKGRSTDSAMVVHPFMSSGGRSTGLFDFDNTCTNSYYDVIFGINSRNLPLGIVTGVLPISNKPGPIGGVTPNDGKFSTLSSTGVTEFARSRTGSLAQNIATATPTTFFAATQGMFIVQAYIGFSAAPALYTAQAFVLCDGNGARIIANNGTSGTITLSGLDVQATQTSGVNQTVTCLWFRVF